MSSCRASRRWASATASPTSTSVNARLEKLTGWRVVGVPGLIPDAVFYDHLAHRRFPVTVWIRTRAELDYLVEPDLFHDFFGHVPLLSDPVFADYMQSYGQRALEAGAEDRPAGAPLLVHGRVRPDPHAQGPEGLRRRHPVLGRRSEARDRGQGVERLPFEAATVMRRPYEIDKLQNTYFVLDDFRQLFEAAQTRVA